jgi:hypothetical protein
MKKGSGLLLIYVMLLFGGLKVNAQHWEIGAAAGGAGYMGDLNMNKPLKFTGPALGGFVKINLDPFWAIGMHYNYGRIEGDNGNLKFYAPIHEVSALVDFNFMEFFTGGGSKKFTPFIYTGLGGVIFNPKRNVGEEVKYLRTYRTENQFYPYKNYTLVIPYGAGVKFKLKSNISMFGHLGYRTAYTDYLDDVSTSYRRITDGDPERIYLADPSGDPGKIGSQRGDSRKRDSYMFTQIGISYTIICKKCEIF